jgi:predicted DNA-binding transcriptional regulator YafY
MKRTSRLLAITNYLRGRRTAVSAEELASRFGVTLRTIYRDLDSLRDAELPVLADRGPGGGYALHAGYALPPVNFTEEEAATLLVSVGLLLEMRMMPLAGAAKSAAEKVRSAIPKNHLKLLDERLASLSFVGVPALVPPAAVQKVIELAWRERALVQIHYAGAQGATTRLIRIEGFVLDRHETLMNATDLSKGERRQFKLHRIERAKVSCGQRE